METNNLGEQMERIKKKFAKMERGNWAILAVAILVVIGINFVLYLSLPEEFPLIAAVAISALVLALFFAKPSI